MQNGGAQAKPFDFICTANIGHFFSFIQWEHPQTIALVLSCLEPNKASVILQNLPNEIQSEVTRRIACMGRTSPGILKKIERVLEKKLSAISDEGYYAAGGVDSAVAILTLVDRYSEKQIIETLEDNDPELAEEIKRRMFVFENIVVLNDRAIQKVLREVDSQELAMALKGVRTDVQNKIFRNMSKRAATMLKEDMEYMGAIRLRDVEEVQQKIVSIIRHLEDTGEIVIARSGEDELVGVEYVKPEFEWDNILSLGNDKVKKVLAEVDHQTLAMALVLTRLDVFKKLTKPMGLFRRFRLKRTMRKFKNLSVHDVADAQGKIVSVINKLSHADTAGDVDD